MARKKKTEEPKLTPKQELFCQYYAKNNNALQSYLKAYGCSKETAIAHAYECVEKRGVKKRVAELKAKQRLDPSVTKEDMILHCLKVVGADIGEYLRFSNQEITITDKKGNEFTKRVNVITLEDSDKVDTNVIAEVKQGRDGISVKLEDKRWAWEKLEKYLGFDIDSHVGTEGSAMQSLIDALGKIEKK